MIVLTTGKGGVGKTTLSAATAVASAAAGFQTVVVSVDPAHSLGDVLDLTLTGDPLRVAENLDAIEIRLSDELTTYWGKIQNYLSRVFQSQGVESWLAEDVAFLPGLEEIVALLRLKQLNEQYERVIVDCPPTGSTLRYLNLPEAIRWYMEKFFPTERKIVQAIAPVAERLIGVPLPDGGVLDQMQSLFEDVLKLREVLLDPDQTLAQVVTTPESVVLKEAERAVGYLHVHHVAVARIIANRCNKTQAANLTTRFAPTPVLACPGQRSEPVGLDALTAIAGRLYGDADPTPSREQQQPLRFEIGDARSSMTLSMPKRANKDQLRVGRQGDDLVIDLGPVRRHLPLPPAVARQNLVRASWSDSGVFLEFQT